MKNPVFFFSPMAWLPTPPHLNQSALINGTYSCSDNRSLSVVQSPDFLRSKRNSSSLEIDASYPMYQVYQDENLTKQTYYPINGLPPTTLYQQTSVRKKKQ